MQNFKAYMSKIAIFSKSIQNANCISVSVGTNCPAGGDSGHGGRTTFKIKNDASTDLRVAIGGMTPVEADSVEIILGGDTECETLIEALEFALDVLKKQHAANCLPSSFQEIA
jgi:hypothetical protein